MSGWQRTDGPVLRIEDLSVRFDVRASMLRTRPIAAVTQVSLELATGETVAVVGESGSGKTTLGRATLRLVPAAEGRVVFEGEDIAELQAQRDLTFLYITHDLASARHFADRIAVMYAGRVVELASAQRLIEEPQHPYTKALLAAVPEPDPANRLRQRPVVGGEPPDAGDLPPGCAFAPRCPAVMAGRCERDVPGLIQLEDGHEVACHLYSAGASVSTSSSAASAADSASSAASTKGSSASG